MVQVYKTLTGDAHLLGSEWRTEPGLQHRSIYSALLKVEQHCHGTISSLSGLTEDWNKVARTDKTGKGTRAEVRHKSRHWSPQRAYTEPCQLEKPQEVQYLGKKEKIYFRKTKKSFRKLKPDKYCVLWLEHPHTGAWNLEKRKYDYLEWRAEPAEYSSVPYKDSLLEE